MNKSTAPNIIIPRTVSQNHHPVLSIAIPFHNSEKYLKYSIQSVINQTYNNWELFLIDDGSTDGSLNIANYYAELDKRIHVISDGLNKGLAYRLNESISLAHGIYYCRMDDDDIMTTNRVERQMTFLMENPNVDVVGSSAMIIDGDNKIIRSANMEGISSTFIHPTVMGKTEWFKKYQYNTKLLRSQDKELWLRTSEISSFYNIPEPLLFYRELGQYTLKKLLRTNKALRSIYKGYKAYGKSFGWFIKNYFLTFFKDLIYISFTIWGKTDLLIKRRKRYILPSELCLHRDDIEKSIRIR